MKQLFAVAIAALSYFTFDAHAEVQTWRLKGVVERHVNVAAPDWLAIGQSVNIDFYIDTSTPAYDDYYYYGAIVQVLINGSVPPSELWESDILAWDIDMFAITIGFDPKKFKGLEYVFYGGTVPGLPHSDLGSVLNSVSGSPYYPFDYIGFEFAGEQNSVVLARAISFEALPVPEPEAVPMAFMGVLMLAGLGKRLRTRH